MKYRLLILLVLFVVGTGSAQVLHNATVELVGSPTWVRTINLEKEGLVLVLKEDQTRFKVVRYNVNLEKLWEENLFLDTERQPASVNLHGDRVAFIFSETSGMFYQIIDFDINDGTYVTYGFEVRDYFVDKALLMFDDKAVMVGTNEKGIAYFDVDLVDNRGKIVNTELGGTYNIEHVSYGEDGDIKILATERILGYKNEKKKKGEYLKSTKVVAAVLDREGEVKSKKTIEQWDGKFPISAIRGKDERMVSGIYQEPDGNKGFYFSFLTKEINVPTFAMGFAQMDPKFIVTGKKKKNIVEPLFHVSSSLISQNDIYTGGLFYEPQYQTYRTNTGMDPVTGQRQSHTQTVFTGINFTKGMLFNLDDSGRMIKTDEVDVNLLSRDLNVPFTYNNSGALAYVSNGILMVVNPAIGNLPIQYKLSEDQGDRHVAGYNRVMHWYDNVFLALGSQDKVEAYQMEEDQNVKSSKKKKKDTRPFIQTRRTYFITAISSGRSN